MFEKIQMSWYSTHRNFFYVFWILIFSCLHGSQILFYFVFDLFVSFTVSVAKQKFLILIEFINPWDVNLTLRCAITYSFSCVSVQFSCSFVSDSLQPHEPQHARPPCPSPTPRVHPNPCPLSQWCYQGSPKLNKSFCVYFYLFLGFSYSSVGKESACNAGDPGLIPGSGRSAGEGIGYPL